MKVPRKSGDRDRQGKKPKPRKVFRTTWRNKFLTVDAESIEDMIQGLQDAADTLRAMKDAGIVLDKDGNGVSDDYAQLVTTDPEVAEKFGLEEEEEEEKEEA